MKFSTEGLPKPAQVRLRIRAYSLIAGIYGGLFLSILTEEGMYRLAIIPTAIIICAGLAEFIIGYVIAERLLPATTTDLLDRLQERLGSYESRFQKAIGDAIQGLIGADISKVSGTFHLKVDLFNSSSASTEPALVQVADYKGPLGGKKWRFTPCTKGLVGRCLRTGNAEFVNFADAKEYTTRMVTEFGYLSSEIASHTKDARSYWAQPVLYKDHLVGVLFLFSTVPEVFPSAVSSTSIQAASNEIVAFLEGARLVGP